MKNGTFRFIIISCLDNRRKRLVYLVSLFLCAIAMGYLFQLKSLSLRRRAKLKPLQIWEQPNLLNLEQFTWKLVNKTRCIHNPDYPKNTRLLPILVHSSRDHFNERVVIRKSWGSVPLYKKWDVRLVFLLGEKQLSEASDIQEKLNSEQKTFGDLVIGNFIDSYVNMTYKHMMGYKWILNFCKKAKFVLKVDDNIFIDILKWLDWRSEDVDQQTFTLRKIPDLYCHTFDETKPFRNSSSKWYASESDWPYEYYPDYCSGAGYGITVDLIQKLYSVSQKVKMFWIDDVFVTGVLMDYLKKKSGWTWAPNVKHLWGNVTIDKTEFRDFCDVQDWNEKREFRVMVYVPRGELFERDMICMWNKTLHDKLFRWSD